MVSKFPPKGYRMSEHPLPHNFFYYFQLNASNATKNSTVCSLIRTSDVCVAADSIEVNPRHASFAEDKGPLIQRDSIIPRMTININAKLTKGAIETDALRTLKLNYMPYYCAFLDTLDAEDEKTGTQIEDILELQHDVTNQDTYPLFGGVNLASGTQALSTVNAAEAFGDYGLSVDSSLESVAFSQEVFFDAMQYYTNQSMLKKVTGKWNTVVLTRDRMFNYFSNNFTYPTVKRGNPYTFCGILFEVQTVGNVRQIVQSGDVTDIPHIDVGMTVRYDEWNPLFDQTTT